MPQIDLEPKDYRAQPLKGERVFVTGGLRRLAIVVAWLVFGISMALIVSPISHAIIGWVRVALGR